MGMIERVARALCLTDGFAPDATSLSVVIPNWKRYKTKAKVALQAMYEPSEAMVSALDDHMHDVHGESWGTDALEALNHTLMGAALEEE